MGSELKIEKRNIIDLIFKNKELQIPYFQREYTWTYDPNILVLLDNLNKIDLSKKEEYYLGSIILKSKIIVDGQQRMSTFLLILKAIYINLEECDLKKQIKFQIIDGFRFESFNINDKYILEQIITSENDDFVSKKSNYIDNYNYLKKYFNPMTQEELISFYNKLNFVFVSEIKIGSNIDETLLYEQINSTGKALTSFDLIKNDLLFKIQKEIDFNDKELEKYINQLDNISTIYDNGETIKNINEYRKNLVIQFISYYTSTRPTSNNDKSIYQTYKNLFLATKKDIKDFFNIFINFGIYFKFFINDESSKFNFYKQLIIIRVYYEAFMPLLVDILYHFSEIKNQQIIISNQNEENIKNCLLIIEKYIVYRNFNRDLNTKGVAQYIRRLPKIISAISNEYNLKYQESLYIVLILFSNKKIDKKYYLPSNNEFRDGIISAPIYRIDSRFTKNILIRLNFNDKNNAFDKTYSFYDYNIEHIISQEGRLYKYIKNTNDKQQLDQLEIKINQIGNLVLLNKDSNSLASNKDYIDKLEDYKKSVMFPITSYLINKYPKEFTIKEVDEMNEYVYSKCLEIWDNFSFINKLNESLINKILNFIENINKNTNKSNKQKSINNSNHYKIEKHTNNKFIIENYYNDKYDMIIKTKSRFRNAKYDALNDIQTYINFLRDLYVKNEKIHDLEQYYFNSPNTKGWIATTICSFLGLERGKQNKMTNDQFNVYIDTHMNDIKDLRDTIINAINNDKKYSK